MPDDNWERIQRIFLEAADLPAAQRSPFLDSACQGDTALREEVESLLSADADSDVDLASEIEFEALTLLQDSTLEGARLGAYRAIREIGRGGMGTVFLACRDDDQYRKQVAIKVVKRGMDTAEVLGRFRHERQILANLDHPYIARLIDGGTTPDGRPFFVMEHVEGQPIDAYCREKNLDVEGRLRLFLQVCEAVSHAHRSLVVHRDLKPGNILVSYAGVPKLLDFGVAKLLEPDLDSGWTSTATAVAMGPLTPDYASPEQVRGQPVTTAADVYALGAILYELLTEVRAQKVTIRTPAEIERVVCESEPVRPSLAVQPPKLRRRLQGDLDNIILMAMRKEQQRRYPSVDQLAEDVRRHLQGRAVLARQDSFAYRAGKYLWRNAVGIAAATLIAASLVGGSAVAVWQARQAEAARRNADAQRQSADRERARAETEAESARREQQRSQRRLAQMVELADRSLYDVHTAIERLPGATEARQRIVATTLRLLEDFSKDASQDEQLQAVLSSAYRKVADVQASPARANLGDSKGATANYDKAAVLVDRLLVKAPHNPEYLRQKVQIQIARGQLLDWDNQPQRAVDIYNSTLEDARRLARLCPARVDCRLPESEIYSGLAGALERSDSRRSLENARKQVQTLLRISAEFPANHDLKLELAAAHSQLAGTLAGRDELAEASREFRESIAMREAAVARNPADVVAMRGLMISYANLASILGSPFFNNLGDTDGARTYFSKTVGIARELSKADGNDRRAKYDLATAVSRAASIEPKPAERAASLTQLREAEGILRQYLEAEPKAVPAAKTLSLVEEYAGHRLRDMGQPQEALAEFRRSLAVADQFLAINPTDASLLAQALADEEAIAQVLASQGEAPAALESARKAVVRARQMPVSDAQRPRLGNLLAIAHSVLASVQRTLGDCAAARTSAAEAMAVWSGLPAGPNSGSKTAYARTAALLKQCEASAR